MSADYTDQALTLSLLKGVPGAPPTRLYAAYTPWGIHGIDSDFAARIMETSNSGEAIALAAEIQANPHLHQEIKDNLLLNLRNWAP